MKKILLLIAFLSLAFQGIAQEKEVYDIKFQGHKKNKIGFLKKYVSVRKGDKLDSLQLEQDVVLLKRLAGVSHAYYQVFYSHDNLYNVFFNIEENFTLIPNVNVWTTTNEQLAYKIGLYDYNFLGRNIAFGGFYQNNGFDSYGINLRAPNLFTRNFGIALNHQNWTSEEPLYFDQGSANYKYSNTSFEILALYQINFKNRLQFGINIFKEEYDYLSGVTSNAIPQSLSLDKQMLKFVYEYDNLNYYYQYIEGIKNTLYLQYVTTENDFQDNFLIGWSDFMYFKRIGEKGNWANRLRFGVASNNASPFAPFSVDNNLNVRGVGNIIDRGTASLVLNTEYRYTLYEKGWFILQGNGFVDAGTWRNPGGTFSDFTNSENFRIYPGVGLRFIHKRIFNAIFRIDYGYGVTKNASNGIVFGIGQYF
ncbi:outer membrane protein assembly factor [uncultured Kordia sp.]|uniref:outer membrane protein assembly factor n=1 Tax=uncultured Kordia sp. TaxID=507699 RepID=UPI002603771C|nr:outer membrane protein assembly factor [uncultured Kordia sp.]